MECLNCGNVLFLDDATRDSLGWHSNCNKCGSSSDIDITTHMTDNELMSYEDYIRQNEIDNRELMEDLHLEQLEQM